MAAHSDLAADDAVEIQIYKTTGDRIQDRALIEIGGKGLFTKEIEDALLRNEADIAVHSMKDVPTIHPDGLIIECFLEREDPADAWIARGRIALLEMPPGAVVGTSSLRRAAQVLHARPDLTVVPLRGNVDTRLSKVADGSVDATMLALAGLNRLGRSEVAASPLPSDAFLPALAQGAIGIQCRESDDRCRAWLDPLNHPTTDVRVATERAFLTRLDGSCRTPIAGLAVLASDGCLTLDGLIAKPDGTALHRDQQTGAVSDAALIGTELAERLLAVAGPDFLVRQ